MATGTAERERANGRNGNYQQFRTIQQQEDRERIRGEWMPCDDSDNRLEIAETDDPQLVALRDSYHHGRVIFATRSQVRNFARAVTGDDRIRDAVRA